MSDTPSPPPDWRWLRSPFRAAGTIDPRWWSLGLVDGYKQRDPQPGVPDQYSYKAGRIEGKDGRRLGWSIDFLFARFQLPYREAHFAPIPSLWWPPKESP